MAQWRRIVVGVDGSEYSRTALRYAAEEAKEHGAEVVAVSVWTPVPLQVSPPFAGVPWGHDVDLTESVTTMLRETVSEVLGDEPEVAVRQHVTHGSAAKVLIDLASDEDLIVVGSRGHGAFAGMLLGSVSQHVIANATCPVLVVR